MPYALLVAPVSRLNLAGWMSLPVQLARRHRPDSPRGSAQDAVARPLLPRGLLLASMLGLATAAASAEPPDSLEYCASIGPAADRLACYDRLAGRAPSAPPPVTPDTPPSASLLAPKDVPVSPATAAPSARAGTASVLSRFWELDPEDKRGTFNFTGYRTNYVMPVHVTSHINRSPQSPTQAAVSLPAYRKLEAKFQLSLRTKIAQDVLLDNADVWLGFTQQVMWQIWNGTDSKPFRNTDYEPEVIFMVPVPKGLRELPGGPQWRYVQAALAHQSNGQSDPLSRSWNRIYLGTGFEWGNWALTGRYNYRLSEDVSSDNNPDLLHYRGRGELQLAWSRGAATTLLSWRTSLSSAKRGAWQLEWTYPVFADQPNGLRWYVQGFSGYGETLTDYNFKQNSLGAGVSFMQF
ncbi:phospholipase A [Rhizobacter sp. LjRoot28]|uniref:phospholipase A n=1 Tax=Rhizobacter sp. LjRoot28 TaxID=3342309 RepID=UPI003ECFE590